MNALKIVLLIIAIIIAIPLIVALFIKKEYLVEREITINKPTAEVFDYIRHLKNQDYYSKWVMTDPNMKKYYRGTDGTVGFVYGWNGNDKAGEGEQEIKAIKENESLDVEVRFQRPFKNTASTPMTVQSISPSQTKVVWGMKGENKYPLNFMNLFVPGMLGKDLDISLKTLKGILEKS